MRELCPAVGRTHDTHNVCRTEEGGGEDSGPTLALSGVTVCLEMDLLLDETWPVFGSLHSCAAAELVAVGLLEALKGALSKFQGHQRLLGLQGVVLVAHHPSLVSKCGPAGHAACLFLSCKCKCGCVVNSLAIAYQDYGGSARSCAALRICCCMVWLR